MKRCIRFVLPGKNKRMRWKTEKNPIESYRELNGDIVRWVREREIEWRRGECRERRTARVKRCIGESSVLSGRINGYGSSGIRAIRDLSGTVVTCVFDCMNTIEKVQVAR